MSKTKLGEDNPMFNKTHPADTLAKMSVAKSSENHPRGFLSKTHSPEALAKISEAHKGKIVSAVTKAKISQALSGENHPMYNKTGINHHSCIKVFVYSSTSSILEHEFHSQLEAAF